MKRELRDKWVSALRSGEYEQGAEFLFSDKKYCCLGVLCVLTGIFVIAEKSRFPARTPYGYASFPEDQIFKSWDLDRNQGYIFARMNDNGHSFAEIADRIESEVPVID